MIDAARVLIADAAERVHREAKRAIAAVYEGDMLMTQLAVLKRFGEGLAVDTIALRRRIAAAVQRGTATHLRAAEPLVLIED